MQILAIAILIIVTVALLLGLVAYTAKACMRYLVKEKGADTVFRYIFLNPEERQDDDDERVEKGFAERMVEKMLFNLNCEYEKRPSEDYKGEIVYRFQYQRGFFLAYVREEGRRLDLNMPQIFVAEVTELGMVSALANRMNLYKGPCKVIYNNDSGSGRLIVSLTQSMNMYGEVKYMTSMLKDAMDDFFYFLGNFNREAQRMREEENKSMSELTEVVNDRYDFLMHEQEMKVQERTMPNGALCEGGETLEVVVRTLNAGVDLELIDARLLGEETMVFDLRANSGYKVVDFVLERNEDGTVSKKRDSATLEIRYNLKGIERTTYAQEKKAIMMVETEGEDKFGYYVRVSLFMSGLRPKDFVAKQGGMMNGYARTVLLRTDKRGEKAEQKEFEFLYADARDKVKEGNYNDMTDEQKLLYRMENPEIGMMIFWAERHLTQKRWYQAIYYLERAYRYFNERFDELNADNQNYMKKIARQLSYCYLEIGQPQKASYYGDVAAQSESIQSRKQYILSMIQANDYRAEDMLRQYARRGDEARANDELNEASEDFVRFVKRNLVLLLVGKKKRADALAMLKKMNEDKEDLEFVREMLLKLKDELKEK